ncbi:VOC family protein [Pikeienuella piscinae]|uniref:VOC family protein n=1 Tax=Pikeienuella piscinae TaxID=2748098 RepID=A0A7L5BTY0_9RHOB|nr:VOC family protein [Pikeienuella piscinae]QIE54048.1 VOC family protein [Pikeienuella piscinae]
MTATPSLTPYIVVDRAREAIAFYTAAFGAEVLFTLTDPDDGRIGHAELKLGASVLMLADEYPDFGALAPGAYGGSPVKLHFYVEDVDAVFARAVSLGAAELRPVKAQFHGDRSGMLADPFGHIWFLATKGEEVPPEEMQARWDASMAR